MHPIVEGLVVRDLETIVAGLVPLFAPFVLWVSLAVLLTVLVAAAVGLVAAAVRLANARRRIRTGARTDTPGAATAFGARRRETIAAARPGRVIPLRAAMRPADLRGTLRH